MKCSGCCLHRESTFGKKHADDIEEESGDAPKKGIPPPGVPAEAQAAKQISPADVGKVDGVLEESDIEGVPTDTGTVRADVNATSGTGAAASGGTKGVRSNDADEGGLASPPSNTTVRIAAQL